MTREEILSMEPGPELDRLVAERVMGWEVWCWSDAHGKWGVLPYEEKFHVSIPCGTSRVKDKADITSYTLPYRWSPSTDIAAAWEVVQCLVPKYNVEIWNTVELNQNGEWQTAWVVDIRSTQHGACTHRVQAPSLPLAICRAALLAVQSEKEEA